MHSYLRTVLRLHLKVSQSTNGGLSLSLQGSDGKVQEGLQHEEEQLPSFVHNRDPLNEAISPLLSADYRHKRRHPAPFVPDPDPIPSYTQDPDPNPYPTPDPTHHCGKCTEFFTFAGTPLAVTQKMETPVVYFYTDQERKVKVDIGFPNGIISQYYPAPTEFSPAIGDVTSLSGGQVSFDVDVIPDSAGALNIPTVDSGNIYAPSREVASNYLRSGSETERFIFYRGLGNFSTDFQVTSRGGALTLHNRGADPVASVFLVYVTEGGGAIRQLNSIAGHGAQEVSAATVNQLTASQLPIQDFLAQADPVLTHALISSGLYTDEAQAMTNTWKKSYFRTPGLRVLYALSRQETEHILPMHVTPQPESLIRTLVGRVEVMRDTDEQALLAAIHARGQAADISSLGRFAEAKLRRLLQLTADPNDQRSIQALISHL